MTPDYFGILPINKARDTTSFHLVSLLRKRTRVDKIGHAGTLDPLATGVMIMLIGRPFTLRSNHYMASDKQYRATIQFGMTSNTFDSDGQILSHSLLIPSLADLENTLLSFQGDCQQIPPMFSAKKVEGQKLYNLARKGIEIDRQPIRVQLTTTLLRYEYPYAELDVICSKGTYIRTLAHDLGQILGCGALLSSLSRTRSGSFSLSDCIDQKHLTDSSFDLQPFLRKDL